MPRSTTLCHFRSAWFVLPCLLQAAPAPAKEHYLAVFAAESAPYRPKNTHTFATVIRVDDQSVESHTISWLPRTLKIEPVKFFAEPGFNPTAAETIEWAHRNGLFVSVWGPYRIRPELYERFVALKAYLDGGALTYHVASAGHPTPDSTDCAHALEKLTTDRRRYIGPYGFGEPASARIVENLAPWIVEPETAHWEAAERAGLGCYELVRHDYCYRPTRRDSIRSALGK